jgi:hypothetical protein
LRSTVYGLRPCVCLHLHLRQRRRRLLHIGACRFGRGCWLVVWSLRIREVLRAAAVPSLSLSCNEPPKLELRTCGTITHALSARATASTRNSESEARVESVQPVGGNRSAPYQRPTGRPRSRRRHRRYGLDPCVGPACVAFATHRCPAWPLPICHHSPTTLLLPHLFI